jgi:hypothetical protein
MIIEIKSPEKLMDGRGVYLAGGISDKSNWQDKVVKVLTDQSEHAVCTWTIYNPRNDKLDFSNATEKIAQTLWKYKRIEACEIFSMYFDSKSGVQPMCMYELGRNLERIKSKYPYSWEKRIIVSCEKGYEGTQDVCYQTYLATMGKVRVETQEVPFGHAIRILQKILYFDPEGIPKLFQNLNKRKQSHGIVNETKT